MSLQLRYHRHPPEPGMKEQRNYYFDLTARVKSRKKALHSSGECTAKGNAIGCGVDCDGGGFVLRREPSGTSVVLSLERIRMTEGCGGEENYVDLTSGADDRSFRLDKTGVAQCRSGQR